MDICLAPPSIITLFPCKTRSSLTCVDNDSSPTSSKKNVPLLAYSIKPNFKGSELVKALFSYPNNLLSKRFSGIAPQLMETKGWFFLIPLKWMALAMNSLPLSLSPVINKFALLWAVFPPNQRFFVLVQIFL